MALHFSMKHLTYLAPVELTSPLLQVKATVSCQSFCSALNKILAYRSGTPANPRLPRAYLGGGGGHIQISLGIA